MNENCSYRPKILFTSTVLITYKTKRKSDNSEAKMRQRLETEMENM